MCALVTRSNALHDILCFDYLTNVIQFFNITGDFYDIEVVESENRGDQEFLFGINNTPT